MKASYLYTLAAFLSLVIIISAGILYSESQVEPDPDVSALSAFCVVHMLPELAPGEIENCDVWAEAFLQMYPDTREECMILVEYKALFLMCLDNRMNGR